MKSTILWIFVFLIIIVALGLVTWEGLFDSLLLFIETTAKLIAGVVTGG